MTGDDLQLVKGIIVDAVEGSVKSTVPEEIKKTVNGKIDKLQRMMEEHNAKHEEDMQDILPIVRDFKERQAAQAYAKKLGDGVKWTAGLITALSVLAAAAKIILGK